LRRQNIGVNKILAATKHWHRQNLGVDKIYASTKSRRQQNIGINKILVSTIYWCRKNVGVDKCWRMRRSISLLFLPSMAGRTTRPGQCRRQSAPISWLAVCSWHSASTRRGDNTFEHQRCLYFSRRPYFVDTYILLPLIFSSAPKFLLAPIF
jgi:hypothetical protein